MKLIWNSREINLPKGEFVDIELNREEAGRLHEVIGKMLKFYKGDSCIRVRVSGRSKPSIDGRVRSSSLPKDPRDT